jgi:hypothetical protein
MLAGRGLEIEIEAILNIEILHSIPFHSTFVDLACPILLRWNVQLDTLMMPSKQISEKGAIPNFQPPHDVSLFLFYVHFVDFLREHQIIAYPIL